MHNQCHFTTPECGFNRMLLRPRIRGRRRRSLCSVSGQHMVLDWNPKCVPGELVICCHVVPLDELLMSPGLHGPGRRGVCSMHAGHVQDLFWFEQLFPVPSEYLLCSRLNIANPMPCRQQLLSPGLRKSFTMRVPAGVLRVGLCAVPW